MDMTSLFMKVGFSLTSSLIPSVLGHDFGALAIDGSLSLERASEYLLILYIRKNKPSLR